MISVAIDAIAAGGDGVGRLEDGITVFVPRTAPDDRVQIEVVDRKRRYARGRLVSVDVSGGGRVVAPCPHYMDDGCGGCQLQHLDPEAQRSAKQRIVADAFRRIAGRELDLPAMVPAPTDWRYRTKVTLAVSDDGRSIGFHRHDRPGAIIDLEDCLIAREPLMALWRALRPHTGLFPRGLTGVVLREDRHGLLHVVLRGGTLAYHADALARAVGIDGTTYWWEPDRGAARALAGPERGFPALAFAQVHPHLAERIRNDALTALGPLDGYVVWDLYSGVGDTARDLAAAGAQVHAVEVDRSAVEWARRQEPTRVGPVPRYLRGRVEAVLPRLPEPHAVLLNPPRAGADRRVTRGLAAWGRRHPGSTLVYQSCDPATLARDVGRLPGFGIRAVTAYDLFPHTGHVEVLTVLEAQ